MGMVKAEMYDAGLLNPDDAWHDDDTVIPAVIIPRGVVKAATKLLGDSSNVDLAGNPSFAAGMRYATEVFLRECGVEL